MTDTAATAGLTSAEAHERLLASGPNATPTETPPAWRRLAGKFWAPVPIVLEVAIVFQLALREYVEAAIVAGLLVFNAALGFFQEDRARATLEALKARLAISASVRRDGAWTSLPADQVVDGDVVKLSLGVVAPADVRLLDGNVLLDQSMLTGESLPIEAGPGYETYAGALVRRGEATALVTATGPRTRFGHTAALVRTAHAASAEQHAVFGVVRNLAVVNAGVVAFQLVYGLAHDLPPVDLLRLVLTAVLAAVPVALPATFTLASALAARSLAGKGVLPTRLSAVEEAGGIDVLCADKTGTLTRNALSVTAVRATTGFDEPAVLAWAALASDEGGADPVDAAVRAAAAAAPAPARVTAFTPFDPAVKMSEARAQDAGGAELRVVKGAFAPVAALCAPSADAARDAAALQAEGYRVLAVAAGPRRAMRLVGLVALSDPPRDDAAGLIGDLASLGVRTLMITGDSSETAGVVAREVGLAGETWPHGAPLDGPALEHYGVFAGVFPEDKFKIVKALQSHGHIVGMCGDGANDAPALRQAQMGIAVSTATDVAKSAAGIVLTEAGLGGLVEAVREGRATFQRVLTYTLRTITGKIVQVMFLAVGLVMTGRAILTPALMVLIIVTGDFLAMASTTDNVTPSPAPNRWRIGAMTLVGVALGACGLAFCSAVLAAGDYALRLPPRPLQSLAAVTLVFETQGILYVVRERRRIWSSWPSLWFNAAALTNVAIISILAGFGVLLAPLPPAVVGAVFAATIVFAVALDLRKAALFRRLLVV